MAEELRKLRDEKKTLEARLSETKANIDVVNARLFKVMQESKTQNFTRDGFMFYLSSRVCASAVAGLKDELHAALREHGYGNLVVESVNAQTLSSFVNSQIEENGLDLPEWLDGLVSTYDLEKVCVKQK